MGILIRVNIYLAADWDVIGVDFGKCLPSIAVNIYHAIEFAVLVLIVGRWNID